MKFSILIANYNNGIFFRDCYNSILCQKYSNWEVVIVDDGSTDNSIDIIRNIIGEDSRFKIYTNDVNQGVGVTKGKLIELAKGDICGFLDPDDALGCNAILSSIYTFKKNKDVVLTYSKFVRCDKNLNPINIPKLSKQVLNKDPYFFNYPVQIVHFVTFRKEIYEQTTKIDPTLKIAEDQDLYLKMYEEGKFKFIDQANYFYRMHKGGISQNDNKTKSKEYFARVIFNTMKRRNLKTINGKKIPNHYNDSSEIFDLLEYKNRFFYRIKNRIRIAMDEFFKP